MGEKKRYDTTVARIAGNLLSGMQRQDEDKNLDKIAWAVRMARAIVAEVERTEPAAELTCAANAR